MSCLFNYCVNVQKYFCSMLHVSGIFSLPVSFKVYFCLKVDCNIWRLHEAFFLSWATTSWCALDYLKLLRTVIHRYLILLFIYYYLAIVNWWNRQCIHVLGRTSCFSLNSKKNIYVHVCIIVCSFFNVILSFRFFIHNIFFFHFICSLLLFLISIISRPVGLILCSSL